MRHRKTSSVVRKGVGKRFCFIAATLLVDVTFFFKLIPFFWIFFCSCNVSGVKKDNSFDGPSAKSSRFANLSKQERSQLVEQRHSGKTKGKNKQTNKQTNWSVSTFQTSAEAFLCKFFSGVESHLDAFVKQI